MTNILIEKVNEYLSPTEKQQFMNNELTSDEVKALIRVNYISSFSKPLPSYCPECGQLLTSTEDEDETICTGCGLITSMSIEYVAGERITLPYGRH